METRPETRMTPLRLADLGRITNSESEPLEGNIVLVDSNACRFCRSHAPAVVSHDFMTDHMRTLLFESHYLAGSLFHLLFLSNIRFL